LGVRLGPLGDAFIQATGMLIAPIIFCTVVDGIARMVDLARVGGVALKAILYFEALTTIALLLALGAVNLWKPGSGMNVNPAQLDTSAVQTCSAHPQKATVTEFFMNIIPTTLVGAFTEGNVLAVLLVSLLCAFALAQIGAGAKPLVDFIEALSKMLFQVVGIVMGCADRRIWRHRLDRNDPVASVALLLGIHRLMSEGLTPTNVVGNALVVAKWEKALDPERLRLVLARRWEAAS
jgi:aerobic C4-dicarboxylate transport protein